MELIRWDEKKRAYAGQTGPRRRGLGMACFSYASGTYPVGLELAGARIVMHQDGSVTLQVGATEIGQGSDTVFAQMAAEVLGIPMDMVHVVTVQDTDITPFDPGAYASRQTFVSGIAVRKAALEARAKVLAIAARKCGLGAGGAGPPGRRVVEKALGRTLCTLEEVAMESYYDRILTPTPSRATSPPTCASTPCPTGPPSWRWRWTSRPARSRCWSSTTSTTRAGSSTRCWPRARCTAG